MCHLGLLDARTLIAVAVNESRLETEENEAMKSSDPLARVTTGRPIRGNRKPLVPSQTGQGTQIARFGASADGYLDGQPAEYSGGYRAQELRTLTLGVLRWPAGRWR
jgi:hypothetical protein